MTRLFLLRHGQTEWNATGRLQGSTDIPLNGTGRAQTLVTAERLLPRLGERVVWVTSHLSRAHETAQILADVRGDAVTTDPRLAERAFGRWEGSTHDSRLESDPGEVERWLQGYEPAIDGYEPHAQLVERMNAAMVDHAEANAGMDVVLVSHGSALRVGITAALGLEIGVPRDRRALGNLGNTHWSQLTYQGANAWTLEAHNIGHD